MKQEIYLDELKKDDFPDPIYIVREGSGFLEQHSHPYAVKALVTEGQIDITIGGIKSTYLAGDAFELTAGQLHSENYGGKGVKYLASRKGAVLQEELGLESIEGVEPSISA